MPARKMFRQQVAGLLHGVNYPRCKFGFAKITGHDVRQLPPEFVPALRVNGFIADDGELVRARGHKNKHAIPLRRLVHAQSHEFHLCGDDGVVNVFGADGDPDLAGGLVFGVMNCRDNGVVLKVLGKGSWVHKLPAPSCAAAAKTSAAAGKSTTSTAKATTPAASRPAATGIKKAAEREEEKAEVHKQNDQQNEDYG